MNVVVVNACFLCVVIDLTFHFHFLRNYHISFTDSLEYNNIPSVIPLVGSVASTINRNHGEIL